MLFDYESVITDLFLKKNNLKCVKNTSKKFKEYKKSKLLNRFPYVNKFTKDSFNSGYVTGLCDDNKNKILSFSIGSDPSLNNIPTIIIHRKLFKNRNKLRYVILLIVTKLEFRNLGYGKNAIDEYISYIYKKNKKLEIILHSLKKAERFYLSLGFFRIETNKYLESLEGLKNNKGDNEEDNKKEVILFKYTKS